MQSVPPHAPVPAGGRRCSPPCATWSRPLRWCGLSWRPPLAATPVPTLVPRRPRRRLARPSRTASAAAPAPAALRPRREQRALELPTVCTRWAAPLRPLVVLPSLQGTAHQTRASGPTFLAEGRPASSVPFSRQARPRKAALFMRFASFTASNRFHSNIRMHIYGSGH